MNKHRVGQLPKCGAVDSKYFGNPEQFEKDVAKRKEEKELLKERIYELLLERPEQMESRFRTVLDAIKEFKAEYGIK